MLTYHHKVNNDRLVQALEIAMLMLQVATDRVIYRGKSVQGTSIPAKEITLCKAVQAQMVDSAAHFYFLVGLTKLMVCDHTEIMMYSHRKAQRLQAVEMFKTALRVSSCAKNSG
jgi:cephalosporin-C deacetylase-like acetyl esterase